MWGVYSLLWDTVYIYIYIYIYIVLSTHGFWSIVNSVAMHEAQLTQKSYSNWELSPWTWMFRWQNTVVSIRFLLKLMAFANETFKVLGSLPRNAHWHKCIEQFLKKWLIKDKPIFTIYNGRKKCKEEKCFEELWIKLDVRCVNINAMQIDDEEN